MPSATSTPVTENVTDRVARLRRSMAAQRLDAYVIPSADPHASEYVPPAWQRRAFISGFTGSMGMAVVLADRAFVWADSRYWLQAERELADTPYTLMRAGRPETPAANAWLEQNLPAGARVGVDPQVLSINEWREWQTRLASGGIELVAVEHNLVDSIWDDRPAPPSGSTRVLDLVHAGQPPAEKLAAVREAMTRARADAHVVASLDAIAWLFNIRGQDVDHNPVTIAFAVIEPTTATLFIDRDKVSPQVAAHLKGVADLAAYDDLPARLVQLGRRKARVWVDPRATSQWIGALATEGGASLLERESPIVLAKAVKNSVELAGMRAAHVRDGVAVCRFLHWLETALASGERLDEVDAAERLDVFRAQGEHFQGASFTTISGYAANGAIVHYRPERPSAARLERRGLYLVDSGGQYLDGTTDITRTITLGEPTPEERDRFTRVLRGHIAIATAVFPATATGGQLDTLARMALWEAGLDYGHGTGHGVGHFLCVHEGPQGISPNQAQAKLKAGMILSNEPGYYKRGEYGIRIESLVEVIPAPAGPDGDPFLAFATITMVPIDVRLIEVAQLDPQQRAWINAYHATVRETILPHLTDPGERTWLERNTRPVA